MREERGEREDEGDVRGAGAGGAVEGAGAEGEDGLGVG